MRKLCGAMKAVLAHKPQPGAPNLEKWLFHADAAAIRLEQEGALDPGLNPHDQLSQLNVLVQLEHLMSYPIVRKAVAARTLHLSGWWFDIGTGAMHAYERDSRSFELIDRKEAKRMMRRFAERRRG
jgi:carbonic anhydrase